MDHNHSSESTLAPGLRGKRIVIIGTGKVGGAVGRLLSAAGATVAAVTARNPAHAREAAVAMDAAPFTDNAEAARLGDVVLITTGDDAISSTATQIAGARAFREGQCVLHMSGALPLSVLDPAIACGALVGCAHPLVSCASVEEAMHAIPGSYFGVTAGPGAAEILEALVFTLGGRPVSVADGAKTLYHAAAVVASNYLVTIEDVAVTLMEAAGFERTAAVAALQPLAAGTVRNIGVLGTTAALTGPIVRGDADTVRRHVEALRAVPPEYLDLYRVLGMRTLEIAERRGTLKPEALRTIRRVLEQAGDTSAPSA